MSKALIADDMPVLLRVFQSDPLNVCHDKGDTIAAGSLRSIREVIDWEDQSAYVHAEAEIDCSR